MKTLKKAIIKTETEEAEIAIKNKYSFEEEDYE